MEAEAHLCVEGRVRWVSKTMQSEEIEKKNTTLLCSRSPSLKALPIWQREEVLTLNEVGDLINKIDRTF